MKALLGLLFLCLAGCSQEGDDYNYRNYNFSYDLTEACNTARQNVGQNVDLEDNTRIMFDGVSCIFTFNPDFSNDY